MKVKSLMLLFLLLLPFSIFAQYVPFQNEGTKDFLAVYSINKIDMDRLLISEANVYDSGYVFVYNKTNGKIEQRWNFTEMYDSNHFPVFSTTDTNGVFYTFFNNKIYTYSDNQWTEKDLPGMSHYVVYGYFTVDENNNIWFSTFEHDRKLFKITENEITDLSYPVLPVAGSIGKVLCVNDSVWIPTSEGLVLYANDQFTVYDTTNTNFDTQLFCSIYRDKNGNYWLGTIDDGIYQWDISSGNFIKFNSGNSELTNNFVNVITEDSQGRIWLGTDEGFAKIENGSLQKINCEIENISVISIFIDENDLIYLGTYGNVGLYVYDGSNLIGITGIKNEDIKEGFRLSQNYPNPFNPTTTIEYSIPNVGAKNYSPQQNVQLKIYDVLGREIATLVNEKQTPRNYSVKFDASGLPSGIYFYTLHAGNFVATKKMILMK